ncbi:MAG: 23S rRNA (guanosine-2'-O-)-methyltransferase RlmB, partial [Chlamydiae bacterium]|nr:23S rRNA (guanosine-2'-O-)-methyltransferase RlmB [Chlamydiota bacterium]
MGKNCVQEVLKTAPERIEKIITAQPAPHLKKYDIPIEVKPKEALSKLVQSESHQGILAYVKEKSHLNLKEFLSRDLDKSLVIMLDSIFDPQNLGAILRAAECFGVNAVVWSKNRGVDITPVVSKVSVGATELVDTMKVSNLAETVKRFQDKGYYAVTAEVGEGAESLYDFEFPSHTLLILGSEGKGVQPLISKRADFKVYIPMHGQIDSLNVSQATAVFLS